MTFDTAELRRAIHYRHRGRGAVLIEELRIGCGYGGGAERSVDVWAIESNASKGCTATSYEVKVSRGDFKKDMSDTLKQRGARLFSDQFFFVAPPKLIKPEEVPDWAGLLEPYEFGTSGFDAWATYPALRQIVPAPFRSKDMPSWPLVVSMLRREAIVLNADQLPETNGRELFGVGQ